jgi:hypothetical protein
MPEIIIHNSDILELTLAVPEGHRHLRAAFRLADGTRLVLPEAAVANLARAYVTIQTSPTVRGVRLIGRQVEPEALKEGYATWQLLEAEQA